MANLKEIRGRISSISSTMQITSAMKMVSAAKLKKAQDSIVMLRPYSEKLTELIENVSVGAELESVSTYTEEREIQKVLYIVVSSNRGLAGAFNSNILKEFKAHTKDTKVEIDVVTIGKKGFDSLKKSHNVVENHSDIFDNMSFELVYDITENIMKDYVDGKFDKVFVIYNKFINAATQSVEIEQVLPITIPEVDDEVANTDYIFEPSSSAILNNLIPKSIKTQVYKSVLDSIASEHGARMTAMHKATDNAQELKDELVIFYNKARQTAITGEILEIVSGAEALNN